MKYARSFAIACLLFGWQAGPARAADNGPRTPPPLATVPGIDISWPQCGTELPESPGFAVIGLNDGRPDTTNPCLVEQLAWASGTAGAAAGYPVPVYVNTANPGPGGPGWWPASNAHGGTDVATPYGTCDGTSTAACAYIFGYTKAFDDVHFPSVQDPTHRLWWLDVETENNWSPDTRANTAVLEGMTAYLQSIGAEVGIYSTGYQFGEITGTANPGSNLSTLKEWIAGADSATSAQANCADAPLTPGGTITLTQFTTETFDYNITCPAVPPTQQTTPETTLDANHGTGPPLPGFAHHW